MMKTELRRHSSPPMQVGAWKPVAAALRSSGAAVMHQYVFRSRRNRGTLRDELGELPRRAPPHAP